MKSNYQTYQRNIKRERAEEKPDKKTQQERATDRKKRQLEVERQWLKTHKKK